MEYQKNGIEIIALRDTEWQKFFAELPPWKKEYLTLRGCDEKGMAKGQQAILYSGLVDSVLTTRNSAVSKQPTAKSRQIEHQLFVYLDGREDLWGWSKASLAAKISEDKDNVPLIFYLDPLGLDDSIMEKAYLGWYMAHKYPVWKKHKSHIPQLQLKKDCFPKGKERGLIIAQTINKARYWIDAPAEEMGPEEMEQIVRDIAMKFAAQVKVSKDGRLQEQFPLVEAVGRASTRPPRVVELCWRNGSALDICLVGKGVCFDSGGLNLKSSGAMRMMRKDMGGAAIVLGLAQIMMALSFPITLRVLVPLADNGISGNAFRPGDVFTAKNGKRIEIGNTDAEGRLLLADCLHYAAQTKPDVLIDVATLTGAARVAVGTDIAAFMSRSNKWSARLETASLTAKDPVWRLPLHDVYKSTLSSQIADIASCGESGYAGAITAGLFLEEFVEKSLRDRWMHIDTMAWNLSARPGRPEGGEPQALRALLHMIETVLATT